MTDGTARTYPHGVPSWVDTERTDVDGAVAFYRALFGWETDERATGEPGRRYVVGTLGGQDVAAICSPGVRPGDGTPAWTTYVSVDDVDSTTRGVEDVGGTVLAHPTTLGTQGRVAVVRDPHGATCGLVQADDARGAQRVNEPGTWNVSVLHTPDPERALHFYGPLLGWEVSPDLGAGMVRVPGYGDHLARTVDPGIHERQAFAPPGFADVVAGIVPDAGPARFTVTFAVADRDESVARALAAGAVVVSTTEDEWTRDAVVRDPQGVELTLSQFAPQA
ncbi:VOC family protein [Cellulosimicrobium marinum]|uniref:VOC family protein n=1 Tax=Cellulosimicrobium marinum TaxID=1638992 RepID=UPI001E4CA7B8|nr:VOC family protein [Cellulosimicrobium marinum]MCB7136030.1 VOC family protein [Cellulosimicrobium marinum]